MEYEYIKGIGFVRVKRTSGSRPRIAFGKVGEVELRIPKRYPKLLALKFLVDNTQWIEKHRPSSSRFEPGTIVQGYKIIHNLSEVDSVRVSHSKQTITAKCRSFTHPEIQLKIHKIISKILNERASEFILPRVESLADMYGFKYSSARIGNTSSRWGSCSHKNELVFSSYLVQLEQDLIDYVIVHELAHTIEHNHSDKYWKIVENFVPNHKELRKKLKTQRPSVITSSN